MADWLREPIEEAGGLAQVPGIGPVNKRLLMEAEDENKVETTHQLIGKFLSFKSKGVDSVTHCDAFYLWLAGIGINSNRGNIALAMAEKCELFLPGIYDPNAYDSKQ